MPVPPHFVETVLATGRYMTPVAMTIQLASSLNQSIDAGLTSPPYSCDNASVSGCSKLVDDVVVCSEWQSTTSSTSGLLSLHSYWCECRPSWPLSVSSMVDVGKGLTASAALVNTWLATHHQHCLTPRPWSSSRRCSNPWTVLF